MPDMGCVAAIARRPVGCGGWFARPGVTRQTLQQFLRNSHNYPAAMNFTVDPARIGDLADYIATIATMKKTDTGL
jgi:hypothetical protein